MEFTSTEISKPGQTPKKTASPKGFNMTQTGEITLLGEGKKHAEHYIKTISN